MYYIAGDRMIIQIFSFKCRRRFPIKNQLCIHADDFVWIMVDIHVIGQFSRWKNFFWRGIVDKWCVIISYYFKKFHLITVHFHQKSSSTSNCMDMKITLHEWVKPRSEVAHKLNKAKTNLSICVANPFNSLSFFIFSLPKRVSIIL